MTRTFQLHRDHDVSGLSGTGVVADGATFPDGVTVIRWRGERQSTVVWPSVDDVVAIHGHGGATRLVWDDPAPAPSVVPDAAVEAFKAAWHKADDECPCEPCTDDRYGEVIMTRPSLAGIEKRAAAATEGPWDYYRPHFASGYHEITRGQETLACQVSDWDAAFIADARTAVDALTAAVRDVLAALTPHWDAQVRREAKFGRSGSPCVCEACNAVRALAAHLDLTDPEGDPT